MKRIAGKYIGNLFISNLWFGTSAAIILLFVISFFFQILFIPVVAVLLLFVVVTILDYVLLFFTRGRIIVSRTMAPRLSMGDINPVSIDIINRLGYKIFITLIDELPFQFQKRNFSIRTSVFPSRSIQVNYDLKPLTRGDYEFGNLLLYVRSPVRLLIRRHIARSPEIVKVYPSYLSLKKYQLMALSEHLFMGAKKIRRIGHSLEFDTIKDYITGDDVRSINWKATARRSGIMVNVFQDTRQQQLYLLIDKSRSMKMPFQGMSLLDYSINAALAMAGVAITRQDKVGCITFSNTIDDVLPADGKSKQVNNLLELLYRQQTDFKESDYEKLHVLAHRKLSQRSFLLLFTNFETKASLERQLPYLKMLAKRHLLCVVFFENVLLKDIHESHPDTVEGIYIKTIADRFAYEKKQIVKDLRMNGILSILTTPEALSVDVINKYLELKARHLI